MACDRVRVVAPFFQMQQLVGMGMVAKVQKLGLVTTVTWFFLRWKDIYIQKLIPHHKTEEVCTFLPTSC